MKRMVRRIAACIAALALATPMGAALADGGTAPASPAALTQTNRGANGAYTGILTLLAPEGYAIALSADGAFAASAEYLPDADGLGYVAYYLRAGEANPVFGPYYLPYTFDATAPRATAAWYAAPAGTAQIVLSLSEPAAAVDGGSLRVRADGAEYAAVLAAGSHATRFALPISEFTDASGNALAFDPGVSYTVEAAEGAFTDAAGNQSATSEALTVTVSAEGNVCIQHNLSADMGWTLTATIDGSEQAIESGADVPVGTVVKAVAEEAPVNPCAFAVFSGGQAVADANLSSGYAVSAATEVYARPGALSGVATISGAAEYGQTLTASFSPANGAPLSGLVYAWKRGNLTVAAGEGVSSYTLTRDDIGKTIVAAVISPWCTGEVSSAGADVTKASVAAPEAPTFAAQTDTAAELTGVSGCEYRVNEGAWQASNSFALEKGKAYRFEQRYQETDTAQASPASPALTLNTTNTLTGKVSIEGSARVRSTVTAKVSESNNTGELRYKWMRGAEQVSEAQTYTVQAADVSKALTVEITSSNEAGSLGATTPVVEKAATAAPAAPTLAASTSSSITLNAVAGCEYSRGGTNWQNSPTFSSLSAGQSFTFYQRYQETAATQASPMSAPAAFSTASASLSGTIRIDGDVRYGKTLIATFSGSADANALSYLWYRGSVNVGTGQTYDVGVADINNPIYVRAISSAESGSVTQLVGVVKKAEYIGFEPNAPTRASRSTSKISLNPVAGCEYSRDGVNWQSSAVFTGLKAGTSYKFYQRYQATATIDASPVSPALTTSTSSSSGGSTSGGGSSGGSGSSDDDSPAATATPAGTALTSYTLSGENTRILFSTMESLVTGNKTRDVTIRASGAEFTFAKDTMRLTPGALWYDFGVKLNNCAHQQAARQAAGEHFVALVHYNLEGDLPAKASIRILLGTEQANKTLYYYKFAPDGGALTFMQQSIVDAAGYATVEQSSCSDYVFLDADINAVTAVTPTPRPTAMPEASAAPTALITEPEKTENGGFGGWLILLVVALALLLIVAGIVMFVRSRNEPDDPLDDDLFLDGDYDDTFDAGEFGEESDDAYDGDDEYADGDDLDGEPGEGDFARVQEPQPVPNRRAPRHIR